MMHFRGRLYNEVCLLEVGRATVRTVQPTLPRQTDNCENIDFPYHSDPIGKHPTSFTLTLQYLTNKKYV